MTRTHTLDRDVVHYGWDNATAPRLVIDPGDTVVMKCRDSSDDYYRRGMTAADPKPPPAKGHPLTGPIAVRGARPGDALRIEILELVPGDLGHTAFGPGRGLLPDDFPERYLKMWDLDGVSAELRPGVRIPLEPFLGVMGVALAEPGEHSTIPPRKSGGNMDIKQLTAGTTLYLPVAVGWRALLRGRWPRGAGRRRGLHHGHRDDDDGDAPIRDRTGPRGRRS